MKTVAVPVSELEKLEEARLALYGILNQSGLLELGPTLFEIQNKVSQPMWHLANRKWPEVKETND